MPRKKTYSLQESLDLIMASEGRPSPKSKEPGHTMSMHVGFDESKVGGRLFNHVKDSSAAPIIIDEHGKVADRAGHIEVYQASARAPSKTQAGKLFDAEWTLGKTNAGVFMDLQQAAKSLRDALNSTEGQDKLGLLDGGSKREFFSAVVSSLGADARKMYTAHMGDTANKSDMTHVATFTRVTVGIDAITAGGIHLQTLYPEG